MVIAIIYLIGVILSAAIYLIFIGLNFIGISYLIVYCGGIIVLFLFVIMLLNIDLLGIIEVGKDYSKSLPITLTIAFFFGLFFFINQNFNLNFSTSLINLNTIFKVDSSLNFYSDFKLSNQFSFENLLSSLNQIDILGLNLYSNYSVLLILISFVLLLALIAPIILIKNNNSSK